MNEKFAQYRGRITQYWNGIGKKQKIWLGATAAALLLTVVLLTALFSRTEYELAFRDLDNTDAAAVMSYLDSNGIPYKLSDGGTSISVPAASTAKVKVEAGAQGLIQNGSLGFEAFSSNSSMFGATDREFDVKFRNALNGEIQQLLNGMKGVQKSHVLVTLPQEGVFLSTEDREAASASVMITFKPGYRPTQKEIDGYYNLVKASVPGLTASEIVVSSNEGELMASNNVDGINGALALETHFQIQRQYENDLKREVQQFLSRIVGADNLVVSVSSAINFDKKVTDEQLVKPLDNNNNNGIIISEQVDSRSATGSDGAGGIAGTGSTDIPGYQADDNNGSASSEQNSRITNYDVNRINNQIQSGPYVIKDLSISVAVEKSRLNEESTADISAYLTKLVRSQLVESGQDVNDNALMAQKVSLIAQTFSEGGSVAASSGLSTPWIIGLGVAALALIGGIGYAVVRKRRQAGEEDELSMPDNVEYPTIDLENVNNESQVRKQLETLAKRKPEEFVNLLRTWLVDE
ncbi:flagellar basal-body MS-ring/collar protein FliF [Paenibacillus sp. GCM10027626]|uniref:flagellar basal-body MS-ring/collar protein FliF n=1 Tax=Paenibacillus sp. GCM10027626 TaxID=3273411 RepID=UPI003635B993